MLQHCLGDTPIENIKKMFEKTAWYACNIVCLSFRTHFKSWFPVRKCGALKYHLGCDFGRDVDGTFFDALFKFAEKMLSSYEHLFGAKPTGSSTPLPVENVRLAGFFTIFW
jgi:hypothetical protein